MARMLFMETVMDENRLSLKFSAGTCFRLAWEVSCLETSVLLMMVKNWKMTNHRAGEMCNTQAWVLYVSETAFLLSAGWQVQGPATSHSRGKGTRINEVLHMEIIIYTKPARLPCAPYEVCISCFLNSSHQWNSSIHFHCHRI